MLFIVSFNYLLRDTVGSVVNWTDLNAVASHENRRDFDSQVTSQYNTVRSRGQLSAAVGLNNFQYA